MIVKEQIKNEEGKVLYLTYSDEYFKIMKVETQEVYSEAIDIDDTSTYVETEEKIFVPGEYINNNGDLN